jgi:hypothetical protein
MTEDELRARILELLDAETARHPDGAKTRDVQDAILDAVVDLLNDFERDTRAEAAELIRSVATDTRRVRRQVLRTSVDYYLDAFTEDGAYIDPVLDLAFPVGTTDGEVKTLRYWTEEDFHTSVRMTYRKAAEAAEAARLWDKTAERAVAYMRSHNRATFGGEQDS